MKTVKFNKQGMEVIIKGISRPIKNSRGYFSKLGVIIQRNITSAFKNEGRIPGFGFNKWKPFSPRTLKDKNGKWRHRPGTDNSKTRKYSNSSKLLQASGSFKKTFGKPLGIYQISNRNAKIGTNHRLAKDIMSNPTREVIKINQRVINQYSDLYFTWIDKGIKF